MEDLFHYYPWLEYAQADQRAPEPAPVADERSRMPQARPMGDYRPRGRYIRRIRRHAPVQTGSAALHAVLFA